VGSAGDHAVHHSQLDHHGAEVAFVLHDLQRPGQVHALVRPELGVPRGEVLAQLGAGGINDVDAGQINAPAGRELPDVRLPAQQGQVADVPALQDLGRLQDPHVLALRQHNVPALRAGPLDEVVQEPQRGHALGPGQVQAFEHLGLVHLP
jgi:hypothetical protein